LRSNPVILAFALYLKHALAASVIVGSKRSDTVSFRYIFKKKFPFLEKKEKGDTTGFTTLP